jgi:hypothetical protein
MTESMPFIPGKSAQIPGLLSRFLPPIPIGIATEWLGENLQNDGWVLDPFGSSPEFALEIARAGYKVLVSANNPIARFMLDLGANSPSEEILRTALAALASARVGEERLENHLQDLYKTTCSKCGQFVIADAFLWERSAPAPYAKIYDCIHCGESGEHPVNQSDIEQAQSFASTPIHQLRVLERIAPHGDPDRANAAEALSVYLPRAIYGLVTLINRLDGLLALPYQNESDGLMRTNCLIALVLSALDKGNNLWSYPSGRPRPKQLSASPRFREENLWLAVEGAVKQIASNHDKVLFTRFPEIPKNGGGVILYEGPLRELSEQLSISTSLKEIKFNAVMSVIPRHNQAFWTLSAIWTGWIWGRESIGPFKSVLRRRRYDWSWHTSALNSAFRSMVEFLPPGLPIFGLIGEAESNFLSSALIAAGHAGLNLRGIALRAESNLAQILWECSWDPTSDYQLPAPSLYEDNLRNSIISSEIEYLSHRGEPAPFITLYTSALKSYLMNHELTKEIQLASGEEYHRIDSLIEEILSFKHGFIRYGGGEKSPETSHLWHQDIDNPTDLLSDRVESAVVFFMMENPGCSLIQIDQHICQNFPGTMTPAAELVLTCIESYCEDEFLENENFILRTQDDSDTRTSEITAMRIALVDLGYRLGFSPQVEDPVVWRDSDDLTRLAFFVTPYAKLGEIVFSSRFSPERSIIVVPGARANLIMYKLRNNPYLRGEINRGWRFLKFRYLRHLMESPSLRVENLDTLLGLDPLTETPAQMRLL